MCLLLGPRGSHERRAKIDGFSSLVMAKKLPFLHSVRPMRTRRAGKQTLLRFYHGKLVQPSPGMSILRDFHIALSKRP